MDIDAYRTTVIDLFKNGKATTEQWVEMANAVAQASTPTIDTAVQPDVAAEPLQYTAAGLREVVTQKAIAFRFAVRLTDDAIQSDVDDHGAWAQNLNTANQVVSAVRDSLFKAVDDLVKTEMSSKGEML